mgnify:CR=1 FL=1
MDDEFSASLSFTFEEVRFRAEGYFGFVFDLIVLIAFECVWVDDVDFFLDGGVEDGGFGIFFPGEVVFFPRFLTVVILGVDIFLFLDFADLSQGDVTLLKGLFDIII